MNSDVVAPKGAQNRKMAFFALNVHHSLEESPLYFGENAMCLRLTAYTLPLNSPYTAQRGAQKREMAVFRPKVHFSRRTSATKCKNGWWWTSPSTWNFGRNWSTPFKNADFQSIFAAPQPLHLSKRSIINIDRKSTISFPVSLRWTTYVCEVIVFRPKSEQCAITSKRYERGCKLVLKVA